MIDFKPITLETKTLYNKYLPDNNERGCESSFANLYMWGKQHAAILHDHLVLFSQYNGHNFYSYPIGSEGSADSSTKKEIIDAIIADSKERQILCCILGLYGNAKETLEELYPDMFHFHSDRDSFDYVYAIDDLADLLGRKYHRKRTHCNRFRDAFPDYTVEALSAENLPRVRQMIEAWYEARLHDNPDNDYHMEQIALKKALDHYTELCMEGLVLLNGNDVLAVTLGSPLSNNTFDVHFEKARWDVDGAYTIINCEFAKYIRSKYPEIQFLNREEDLGLEGLRKSKESYYPHHMIEKHRAHINDNTQ